ncbi:MAG: elongation factor G [Gammaproteobacteria bacterium]|nr:elongation factor G [Gammaproteobacteria bacterium]
MSVNNIRNIALAGQAGVGKTVLVERLLFHTGAINEMGEIERGTTHSDHDPQSRRLQYSIDSSFTHFDFKNHRVNLLDTPGTPDFIGRYISILPAVETVALVVDGQEGPGMATTKLSNFAAERKKCRLIIVNKIDAETKTLERVVADLQDRFGKECLPINLPDKTGENVIDCFFAPDYEVETLFSSVRDTHDALIDQVVEVDEQLMEKYLEQGEELDPQQLHEPFETALRSQHLIPICFVSARTGAGIDLLLQILTELMPTPSEGNPPLFMNKDELVAITPDEKAHVIGHVFKVVVDPFMGRLAYIRVHQGVITPESQLYIGDGRKPFKVTHLFSIQGKERKEVSKAAAGDICAVAKVEDLEFNAVVHDSHEADNIHLQPLEMPPPMYSLAVKPQRRGDEQKLSETLKKITTEDPSLQVTHRASLNETLFTGIGEMHLQIALDKMKEQFNLEVDTSIPSIDYRETISKPAEGHHRHKKQTGGAGQFGEVFLRVRPLARGAGFKFVNAIVGGAIPGQFIPATEKGVRQIMEEGAIAGYPMQDIEVELYDGKFHAVDSKEIAFVTAGRKAFLEAVKNAGPLILEPIVNVRITVPSEVMGDITGDMASHRGTISNTNPEGRDRIVIECKVPLTEMSDYSQRLKAITSGEGTFTLEFSHFDPVPAQMHKELSKDYQVKELA